VTFPLSLPGVAAAAILVFVQGLGYFVTPALLGGSRVITLAMYMESHVLEVLNWQLAAAMAMVLLVVCVGIVGGFERMLGLERVWR
jgi:ABC-type spermidine/putrescine transport system permease subunit I